MPFVPSRMRTVARNQGPAWNRIFLAALPAIAAWLFIPQFADAFRIKNHVVSLGSCLLFCWWLASRPAGVIRLPPAVRLALLGCFAAVIVSDLAAQEPAMAWRSTLEYLPLGFLLYSLANREDGEAAATALQSGWLVAATGVAAVALQQVFLPAGLDLGFAAPGKMAAFSTLGNPIWASIVLLAALPLAIHRALAGPRILWLLPPLLLAALWATQSRQAWLALAATGWLAVVRHGSRPQRLLAIAGLALLLGALPWIDFSDGVFHSLKGRLLIMRGAWEMMMDHPLAGVGLGHLGAAYPDYQAKVLALPGWSAYAEHAAVVEDAHDEFLQWGATTGLLGFAGFTLLCGAVAWLGWRSPQVGAARWHWYLGYAGILVTLLFTGIQPQSSLGLLLACHQGVLLAAIADGNRRAALRPALAAAGCIAALAIALLAAGWAVQDSRAAWLEGQGDRLMQERDAWLAGQAYREALSIDGERGVLLRKHASLLYLEGRYGDALNELAKAARYTGDTGVGLLRAEILAKAGRDGEAIAAYRAIVASFPQLISPHFILGQLYYRQHRYDEARSEFQQVVGLRPSAHNAQLTMEKVVEQKEMARVFLGIQEGRQHRPPE